MNDIQITMGAVETLNERIRILQDELDALNKRKNLLQGQLDAARIKSVGSKVAGLILYIIGAFFTFFLFMVLAAEVDGGGVVFFILICVAAFCFWSGTSAFKKAEIDNCGEKIEQLNNSIEKKKRELEEYKQKKKEMVLENERKLSDSLDEKITDSFSFDDIDETKVCPMCAETVKSKARVCRYCGYSFEVSL